MPEYEVKVHKRYNITVLVDADDIEEAHEKAHEVEVRVQGGTPKEITEYDSWIVNSKELKDA